MYRNWKWKETLALGIFLVVTGLWRTLPYIAIVGLVGTALYVAAMVAA